ncbi:MAG: hypothetical protein ACI9ZV_000105 [Candidatus Azotimanducaceae bacterium]|jgi:hypothetical protein
MESFYAAVFSFAGHTEHRRGRAVWAFETFHPTKVDLAAAWRVGFVVDSRVVLLLRFATEYWRITKTTKFTDWDAALLRYAEEKLMRKSCLLITLLAIISITGCLDFGNDEETTSPTKAQIDRCRHEMYLNPSIRMTPLGFKLEGSGIDDAIWLKFKTDVLNLQKIFDDKVVDATKFKEDFTLISEMSGLKWWDVQGKNLLGGQVELPNARFMHVGVEKNYENFVVYIMWHEM